MKSMSLYRFPGHRVARAALPCLLTMALLWAAGPSSAVAQTGTVRSWGSNDLGQLGDGTQADSYVPLQVLGLTDVVAVAAGGRHTVALKSDGTVWAWGSNSHGQLGDGNGGPGAFSTTPVQVARITQQMCAIAAGPNHTIALKADGTVWGCGENTHGQLGDGTTVDRVKPVQVVGLTDAVAIAAGSRHTLALRFYDTVWAWGDNDHGQLGDGTTTDSTVPIQTVGLPTWYRELAAGDSHSLVIDNSGKVWTWGNNGDGQLGDGTHTDSSTALQVAGLSNVVACAAGDNHTLVVKDDGTAWAWGLNSDGQLGDGTTTSRTAPVAVSGLTDTLLISGGAAHSLALADDGTAWAWGSNSRGQLGINPTTGHSYVPVQVGSLSGVAAVDAGTDHNASLLGPLAAYTFTGERWPVGIPGGCGLELHPDKELYNYGERVWGGMICAPAGWYFTGWEGDVDRLVDPAMASRPTVFMTADCHLIALHDTVWTLNYSTEDDLDWVYQNTPGTLANGGHKVRLAVHWSSWRLGDGIFIAKLPDSGPGNVTIQDDPQGDPMVKYIVGSPRLGGAAGPLLLGIWFTEEMVGIPWFMVPFTCRPLGDVDGNGGAEPADVSLLINKLNGLGNGGFDDKAFDLDANGGAEPGDIAILIHILNNQPVP